VLDLHDVNFLPGGAKYGDLPGLLALAAPARLWLAGEGPEAPALAKAIYEKAGAAKRLEVFQGEPQRAREAALAWLLARPTN